MNQAPRAHLSPRFLFLLVLGVICRFFLRTHSDFLSDTNAIFAFFSLWVFWPFFCLLTVFRLPSNNKLPPPFFSLYRSYCPIFQTSLFYRIAFLNQLVLLCEPFFSYLFFFFFRSSPCNKLLPRFPECTVCGMERFLVFYRAFLFSLGPRFMRLFLLLCKAPFSRGACRSRLSFPPP